MGYILKSSGSDNNVHLLSDWPGMYYGTNYQRLLRIKRAVDPDDLFGFQQGIGSRFAPGGAQPLGLSPLNQTIVPGDLK